MMVSFGGGSIHDPGELYVTGFVPAAEAAAVLFSQDGKIRRHLAHRRREADITEDAYHRHAGLGQYFVKRIQ